MEMSDREIVLSYSQAKRKAPQIGILAQLNACRRDRIVAILERHGVYKPRPKATPSTRRCWTPEEDQKLLQLVEEGITRKELAAFFPGRSPESVISRKNRIA